MANILQVTNPSLNTDRNVTTTQEARHPGQNPQIQNPVDPSRVVRADGRQDGKTGTAGEEKYSIIDYDSNYGAFVQRLGDGAELSALVERLMFGGGIETLFAGDEAVADLVQQMLSTVRTDSPEELLAFLKGQLSGQAKFSGTFFDSLRGLLTGAASDSTKETALLFLKAYNDYSAGQHLLEQMRTLTGDIGRLMIKSFRGDFMQLVESMNWNAANGDTAANTMLLNGRLIPFLSNYIARSHDYGAVREAVMHFILHAVKYENGDLQRLTELFHRLADSRDFPRFFKNEARAELEQLLTGAPHEDSGRAFAETFSTLMLKGANGHAGLENIQQFYQIMNGMLLNESVYLPLLHILVPFRYQDKDVMSEMWVDPDAGKDNENEERKIKMLLRFDIQSLGKFEMLLALQDRKVDMQLYVPAALTGKINSIQEHVTGILKENGLGLKKLLVKEKTEDLKLQEVFPEIRGKESTINVRI